MWEICLHVKSVTHDDVMKWKHYPRYRPLMRNIHRSPVISPHKGQWRGALMFSLICVWTNGWVSNRDAGDLKRHCDYYDVMVMILQTFFNKTFRCFYCYSIYIYMYICILYTYLIKSYENSVKAQFNSTCKPSDGWSLYLANTVLPYFLIVVLCYSNI